jgi:hypothetical protein
MHQMSQRGQSDEIARCHFSLCAYHTSCSQVWCINKASYYFYSTQVKRKTAWSDELTLRVAPRGSWNGRICLYVIFLRPKMLPLNIHTILLNFCVIWNPFSVEVPLSPGPCEIYSKSFLKNINFTLISHHPPRAHLKQHSYLHQLEMYHQVQ